MGNAEPIIIDGVLESVSRTIGDTFSGTELTRFFHQTHLEEIEPQNYTKWRRLYAAFNNYQKVHKCSNGVLAFIKFVAQPSIFLTKQNLHQPFLAETNKALSLSGYIINNDGTLNRVQVAKTLKDTLVVYNELRRALESRNVHPEVIKYCGKEIQDDNYFHAVFESVKGLCIRIRSLSNLTTDGQKLIGDAFKQDNPILQINALYTESERDEHNGFRSLLLSIIQMFRNPLAHEAKIEWIITKEDALDLFSTLSFIHRKLDKAVNSQSHE